MADRREDRLTILDLALMVAGVSLGLWLILDHLRNPSDLEEGIAAPIVFGLGGLSICGPPVLLRQRIRSGRRLGPGELLWFCQGTAAWLLWPPILAHRIQARPGPGLTPVSKACFFYGTPLMGLFVALSLLGSGWLRRRRSRRRSGREAFGLILGLAWAVTGLYILSLVVRLDLR